MNDEEFLQIIDKTPLVSIDFIVKDDQGQILLGKRNNAPAKGFWFTPGGRIRKDERILAAFNRLLKIELNLEYEFSNALYHGLFEHFYEDNAMSVDGISTHYVVQAFIIKLNNTDQIKHDNQHNALKWFKEEDLMSSDIVHQNVKDYFSK